MSSISDPAEASGDGDPLSGCMAVLMRELLFDPRLSPSELHAPGLRKPAYARLAVTWDGLDAPAGCPAAVSFQHAGYSTRSIFPGQ
jgi:hypothetical protein